MAFIHPQSSSMAGPRRLAAVPELSSSAASPPRDGLYRDLIRTVAVSGAQRRSTILGHSGSSYSTASSSCPSNNSGHSSGSASAVALERLGNQELRRIAHRMVSDGYAHRMVEAFIRASPAPEFQFGGIPDHALTNWFSELDVDWVLQIDDELGLQRLLRDKPATTQDLVDKWIRALTVIAASIIELVCAFYRTPAVTLFGKASITKMLDVVDVIITVVEAEKLQVVLDMFTCVCGASHMLSIFNEIGGLFERQAKRLSEITVSTMEEVRTLVEEDDSWAIEISRGGGEVHKNTPLIMDCVVSMKNARTSMQNSAPSHNSENLCGVIDGTIDYLKDLLFTKSESCSDQSLRYMFLLNNSYFVAHVVSESSASPAYLNQLHYMDSYLDVSWGYVLSCIPKSRFPGPIHCWINTSSLVKFESAFHKTYQTQKLWKVPDPRLRDALRRAIIERVITGYRNYLEEHLEQEKHVGRESSTPEVLEEMLGELFEG
ncbi:hypothetical protein CFC21_026292 [Triticum aestivum]|uniref:Exocyst subunit Exo70 family protein n=2 Tax=Triticum aestivum TaxID=4565 RepID=A0A3B6CFX4_WHEAT|nr:exocyst complex component EXO70H1-like [Triticum aestivum]KAF7012059.1 hypothetical protein CFC21_026292 [Triticum aestivum]